MRKSSFVRKLIVSSLIVAGLYLVVVLNLYKSTGEWDFNIFKSAALGEFAIFAGACLGLYGIYLILKTKYFK